LKLLAIDPFLQPYRAALERRLRKVEETERKLTQGKMRLTDFASGHEYFGLHFRNGEWVFREWAPNASGIFFIGEPTGWREIPEFALHRTGGDGVWEIRIPGDGLAHGMLYRLRIHWPGGSGDRIPAYARRVVQDPSTLIYNAQVWHPSTPHQWKCFDPISSPDPPLVYEAHVGTAQEEEKVGTYLEFSEKVLPRIIAAGYNTLQMMAVMEHPYYGSFGYHVSSFFAASSRFGTPEELKILIDTAHAEGVRVIIDLVHSHAASNEVEGLSRFDGTQFQFFHDGCRGVHTAWNSRCFDYGKHQVLHFLLSNCRFWLDEYRVDGFRFDGVTSMLYLHHGLGKAFSSYDDYFDSNVDEDALVYLALANKIIHALRPDAISVAEDVSGMPGLGVRLEDGGIGFDYRFAMGTADCWIKLLKEYPDEKWPMGYLWHELVKRRSGEKSIGYVESHDQALVGGQTLIFRLIGSAMYDHMKSGDDHPAVDRGIALIKMIRLITLATAGDGYLNFMANEFGHPEWIDFPREGNGWSYRYARRLWHLADDPELKYGRLAAFDREMIALAKNFRIFQSAGPRLRYEHGDDKIIAFSRGKLLFVFNFHPNRSLPDYWVDAAAGNYRMIFNTDEKEYGGYERLAPDQLHPALPRAGNRCCLSLYLPSRTALVLIRVDTTRSCRKSC